MNQVFVRRNSPVNRDRQSAAQEVDLHKMARRLHDVRPLGFVAFPSPRTGNLVGGTEDLDHGDHQALHAVDDLDVGLVDLLFDHGDRLDRLATASAVPPPGAKAWPTRSGLSAMRRSGTITSRPESCSSEI